MKEKRLDYMWGMPILFVVAVIPLVALIGIYHTDIGENTWIAGTAFYDFFLYYKAHLLMMVALVLAITIVCSLAFGYQGNLREKRQYMPLIPVGIFAIFSFVSAFLSEHRVDAFFGGYEQFEGLFVVLCYVFCFLFCYVYVTDEKWINILLYALVIGSAILSAIGALQAFGIDYMTSKQLLPILTMFMKNVPENFAISASFGEGVSYATLYNPNYVGTYVALVLPVTIAVFAWNNKLVIRILTVFSALCQIIMLVGAQSLTGLLGLVGAIGVAVLFLFSDMKRNRVWLSIFCVGILATAAVLFVVKPDLLQRFTSTTISNCNYTIESIETTENSFLISLDNGKEVRGEFNPDNDIYQFRVSDEKQNPLNIVGDWSEGFKIQEEGFEGIQFLASTTQLTEGTTTKQYDVLRISSGGNCAWDLLKKDNKIYYLNGVGKLDKLHKVEAIGFEHQYDLATNRGYIWSRTLPLLKDTLLFGKGRDNFSYAFPNDDYVGKINCGFGSQTVTKPHNLYMQIWVQDGMFACLAFVILYILLAIQTFRQCFVKGKRNALCRLQIAIFSGVTGYMVAGIANDSTICVAPIYWVLLGLGFAISEIRRKKN